MIMQKVAAVGVGLVTCVWAITPASACPLPDVQIELTSSNVETLSNRIVKARIKNESDQALGGVWIAFKIVSKDRPLPLFEGWFRDATFIAGGLLPGETMDVQDYHFMDERTLGLAKSAASLEIELSLENAATADLISYQDHPRRIDWSDEHLCDAH